MHLLFRGINKYESIERAVGAAKAGGCDRGVWGSVPRASYVVAAGSALLMSRDVTCMHLSRDEQSRWEVVRLGCCYRGTLFALGGSRASRVVLPCVLQ